MRSSSRTLNPVFNHLCLFLAVIFRWLFTLLTFTSPVTVRNPNGCERRHPGCNQDDVVKDRLMGCFFSEKHSGSVHSDQSFHVFVHIHDDQMKFYAVLWLSHKDNQYNGKIFEVAAGRVAENFFGSN